jgi:iron complex outermembrane recepter protein
MMLVRILSRWLLLVASAHALLTVAPRCLFAQERPDLAGMTLEQLMELEVTTLTRSPRRTMAVPAAVSVITGDEIRRSGATSLPELLRMSPGLQVARIDAGKWAVGIRGFADRLARSMRVLIDGRAVYSPLFAGTYWETQHVLLEDVERIEIIRGPGGTLWGSNAVNGIISIVTRPAGETRGPFVSVATGTADRFHGAVRYGGAVGDDSFVRGYVTGFDRGSEFHTGELEYDEWRMVQAGFRLDSDVGESHHLTVQGDAYTTRLGEFVRGTSLTPPFLDERADVIPLRGGNVLARLSSSLGDRSQLELQSFFDRTEREEYPVSEERNTFDVDVSVNHLVGTRQEIAWGLGYRYSSAEIATAPTASLPSGSEGLVSAFLQNEISLADARFRLTLGAKVEHNRYSGLEVQPSGRAVWLPNDESSVWAAVTRAVRRPSRVERWYATTSVLDPTVPAFVRLSPNPDFETEKLMAYEAGYRVQPGQRLHFTVSAFYNRWSDLLSTELFDTFQETTPPPSKTIFPVSFLNGIDGTSFGFEATADIRPLPWWRWVGSYSLLRVEMTPEPGSRDITQESRYEDGSPRHQVRLRSAFDLAARFSLDWDLRYVSELPDLDIPAYATSGVRLAWQATAELEVEVVGRNLHEDHHPEWPGENGGADVEIERSLYIGLIWRY